MLIKNGKSHSYIHRDTDTHAHTAQSMDLFSTLIDQIKNQYLQHVKLLVEK